MASLIVLVSSFVVLRLLVLEVGKLDGWQPALRGALAVMFLLTGMAHFGTRRASFIEMVPPRLPSRDLLVTVTGVLELAGAWGQLLAPTYRLQRATSQSCSSSCSPPTSTQPAAARRLAARPSPSSRCALQRRCCTSAAACRALLNARNGCESTTTRCLTATAPKGISSPFGRPRNDDRTHLSQNIHVRRTIGVRAPQ
jgi:hypothetical protein